MSKRALLLNAKRIVVKVGTSTLTHATGKLNLYRIEKLVRELADLANQQKEILLVTSGAVGAGMDRLGWKEKPKAISDKQAAAAVGQGILMHIYEKLFGEYGQVVAQVLLTREDTINRKRFLNSRNTLLGLLRHGVIPIINENDVVAWEELKIGENDYLSALVAGLVDADALVILSDVNGVYTDNPANNPAARFLALIEEITPEIEELAGGPGTMRGTGGMYTKIQAGKIAMNSGIPLVIAHGGVDGNIRNILAGQEIGTLFLPKDHKLQTRKCWIAYGAMPQGRLTVDAGAERALQAGKSLLPKGLLSVEGEFEQGNIVAVFGESGKELARGIVNYDHVEVEKIKNAHSHEIAAILGYKHFDEVIHRDNLALLI
ncbi:MAG TPA: glutamate 5-kinase [Negativicutes bacterium]|nr:glutamate 5-kinase [Negativicutes bacterium]